MVSKSILAKLLDVRYSSMSLSPILCMNEKVDQLIRKKTHKPNALRFWVEDDIIILYVGSCLIVWYLSDFPLQSLTKKNIKSMDYINSIYSLKQISH